MLLQHLLADPAVDVPVYAAGGIGAHTAAAAVAGGAAGVVLDVQLALAREMDLPADIVAALEAMDGSETRIVAGHRVYTRPDLPDLDPDGLGAAGVGARLGATGLHSRLLPVGQDGPLAAALGHRYKTAGGSSRRCAKRSARTSAPPSGPCRWRPWTPRRAPPSAATTPWCRAR